MGSIIAILLISLVVIYLALSAYAAHVLSTPKRTFASEQVAVFVVTPEEVKFPATDGLEIAGWFIPSAASNHVLLLVHGRNASRTQEFGDRFAEFGAEMQRQGFSVLMIDLRGHGQSTQVRSTFGLTERRDVIGAVDWLQARGYQPSQIGILGVSMGTAAVIGAAADDPEIGVFVLDSAYAEVYPIIQRRWRAASGLPEFFLYLTLLFMRGFTGYDITTSRPVAELAHLAPRPILMIHSAVDGYIPVEQAYQLRAAAPTSEYWETPAAEHARNYNRYPELYVAKVTDFLRRNLK